MLVKQGGECAQCKARIKSGMCGRRVRFAALICVRRIFFKQLSRMRLQSGAVLQVLSRWRPAGNSRYAAGCDG